MIKNVKLLISFLVLGLGLNGCIVVDDDPYYSPYPIGSYEWAIDYYHRPPAPRVSHYRHHGADYKHKKHEHEKHMDKHHESKKHIDKKPAPKKPAPKKPEPKKHEDKKSGHEVGHKDTPKSKPNIEKPSHDALKSNHNVNSSVKKIDKPEHKPMKARDVFRHR